MAVRIRLQRRGKKNYAFYNIVVADSRAPRDGRFIEKLGTYNPNTDPATVSINMERALVWLGVGAQPTLTAKNLLSNEGVLLAKHLNGGVVKGALTQEQADAKWNTWKAERDAKIAKRKDALTQEHQERVKAALLEEAKVNKNREEALAKKLAEQNKAAEEAAATEEAVSQEVPVAEQETTEA